MIITEENFELIAAKYYINPNCTDKEEFLEDFSRINISKDSSDDIEKLVISKKD